MIVELENVGAHFKEFRKVPTLLLQAVDLNGKDISSALAQVLLEPKALIYIETDNLTGKAETRLTELLEDMKNLFDDRVWIILLSENESSERFASVIEKVFDVGNNKRKLKEKSSARASKKSKINPQEQSLVKNQCLEENIETRESGSLDSIKEKDEKICELEKEILELKSALESQRIKHTKELSVCSQESESSKKNINSLEEINSTLKEDLERLEAKVREGEKVRLGLVKEKEHSLKENQEKIEQIEISRRSLEELQVANDDLATKVKTLALQRQLNRMEKSSQTKSVKVMDSPLTHMEKNIKIMRDKFPKASASELLHRSIKNLKCSEKFSKIGEEEIKCEVLVLKGELILGFKDLLSWEGIASNESLAKACAFDNFLSGLLELEQD